MGQAGISDIKNIVILGGSYGGVSTAHYALKHTVPALPSEEYKVIMVSKATEAMCRQACPRALISDDFFPQDKLFVSIATQFEQYPAHHFQFIHGSATAVDDKKRKVDIMTHDNHKQTLSFHALVIATGASTPSPLFGFNSKDGRILRAAWYELRGRLDTVKNIFIAGGGPAGVETAGELGEHLNGHAGYFHSKLQNPKVPVTVITSGPDILPYLKRSIAETAEKYLAKVGVTVVKGRKVVKVTPADAGVEVGQVASGATLQLDNGSIIEADLFIPATGYVPNTGFLRNELLNANGQVSTNPSTLRVNGTGPRVYAIGDASDYARPAVHSILAAVPVLGANLRRDLQVAAGRSESELVEERMFREEKRATQLVAIGRSKGVGSAMGWRLPSWAVWLLKGRDYWLWTVGSVWNGKQWARAAK